MFRRKQTVLLLLVLGLAPAWPNCRAQEVRETTVEVTAETDGSFVREIVVRSSGGDEPQVFFIQDGSEVQPGIIKLRSKLHEGAFLGVHLIELSPGLRNHFGIPGARGLMVSHIVESSPAAQAGIQVGDILLQAEGRDLGTIRVLQEQILAKKSGETLRLELLRDGEIHMVNPALVDSAHHIEPRVLFELRSEAGSEGPDFRFGWHCADVECPRIIDEQLMDDSMVRLRELLEAGELAHELQSLDPALLERIELLERRLEEIKEEIEEQSEPD